jgi:hypothetical protein
LVKAITLLVEIQIKETTFLIYVGMKTLLSPLPKPAPRIKRKETRGGATMFGLVFPYSLWVTALKLLV